LSVFLQFMATDYLFGIFKFVFLLIDLYFLILIVFLFDFSLLSYILKGGNCLLRLYLILL
jgi:hypothetical protein